MNCPYPDRKSRYAALTAFRGRGCQPPRTFDHLMTPVHEPILEEQALTPVVDEGGRVVPRNLFFGLFVAVVVAVFWVPLKALWALSLQDETYSYISLIPPMILGLFYYERRRIFRDLRYSFRAGLPLLALGAVLGGVAAGSRAHLSPDGVSCLEILSLVVLLMGGFVAVYGVPASLAGRFELLAALLMVPLPHSIIVKPIVAVQYGSADVTDLLYKLTRVPVFRSGMTFSLPHLNFVVAYECSGIHSTLALLIGSLLAGHFYLKGAWQKALLVAIVFPIVCFTNGLRMFVLSVLAIYVDPSFFHGNLHHKGGILFFALALVILGIVTKLLRRRRESGALSPVSA